MWQILLLKIELWNFVGLWTACWISWEVFTLKLLMLQTSRSNHYSKVNDFYFWFPITSFWSSKNETQNPKSRRREGRCSKYLKFKICLKFDICVKLKFCYKFYICVNFYFCFCQIWPFSQIWHFCQI